MIKKLVILDAKFVIFDTQNVQNVHKKRNIANLMNKNWRPPSLSELTPMMFNTELTYLGSKPPYSLFN